MKLILAALALSFTACTSPSTPVVVDPNATPVPAATPSTQLGCALEQTLSASIANGVGTALGCTGTDAIQADLLQAAGKANLCKTSARKAGGVIGNIACPLFVSQVAAIGLAKIPAAYGCSGSTTVEMVKQKITDLCTANIKY